MQESAKIERRELKVRRLAIFKNFAGAIAGSGISPNQISILSMLFAGIAAWAFTLTGYWLLLAALGIQLRLLCNLLDGMVAVEYKKRSVLGDLFNEAPDRVSDTLIFVGFGLHGDVSMNLALVAALAAMFTAYIRVLGSAAGAKTHFDGPMAKQQRMALLTGFAFFAPWFSASPLFNYVQCANLILGIITLGCLVTIYRRLKNIANDLKGT